MILFVFSNISRTPSFFDFGGGEKKGPWPVRCQVFDNNPYPKYTWIGESYDPKVAWY